MSDAPSPTARTLDDPTPQPGTTGQPPRMRGGDQLFSIGLTVFEIAVSIIVVDVVKHHGGSDFAAYMWAMLVPLVGSLAYYVRARGLSGASVVVLLFNLLSALVAVVGSHDSKVLLYKDCFVTGVVGLIFLGSIFVGKPVTYYYGERFAAGTDPERRAWWRGLWQYKIFRRGQYQTCLLWFAVMMVEAGAKAWVVYRSSFTTAYFWDQVLPMVAVAIGIVGTLLLARRTTRLGKAAAAREAAAQGQAA